MNESSNTSSNFFDDLANPDLITRVGSPFLIGLAVGYFAKKVIRFGLLVSGGIIALLFILEHFGVISVNSDNLHLLATSATETAKNSSDFLTANLNKYSSQGISAVGGFFVGLKLG